MSEQQQIRPGILLISTGKYKQFVQPLLTQIDELFLTDFDKTIYLFTDEYQRDVVSKSLVVQILILPYRFPYATLYRYRIFQQYWFQIKSCSHLVYLDVDMSIVHPIGEEFITDGLLAIRHPGFYMNNGWGDSNNPAESKSYLPKEKRGHYVCGGVQGGSSLSYISAIEFMANGIDEDEKNGIIPEWNDETFWNHFIHTQNYPVTELSPEYCMPEQDNLRKSWGLDKLTPRILALEKSHNEIRS